MYNICERSSLEEVQSWEVRPDDIFVYTYPKSGTTWMQHIVLEILKRSGSVEYLSDSDLHLSFRFPNLESTWIHHISQSGLVKPGHVVLNECPSPRLIKTHLPPCMMPCQLLEKRPRVIYVSRNPRDVAVSYFHWHRAAYFLPTYNSWDKFFEEFIQGKVINGCVFEHNLFWWKLRQEPNVLFIRYEDMKKNLIDVVSRVANFLDRPLSLAQVGEVCNTSTFSNMKVNPKVNLDNSYGNMDAFMRKGKVDDWRSTFTDGQDIAFEKVCQDKLQGSGLTF